MLEGERSALRTFCRQNDYDRYLMALFAPASRRAALWTLTAFNFEIAKTADVVSEPLLGEIRLQWWRESLESIEAGNVSRRHEVLTPLVDIIQRHQLPLTAFCEMIDARQRADLQPNPFSSLNEVLDYAAATAGNLCVLQSAVLDFEDTAAAKTTGMLYALAGLLRALPYYLEGQRGLASSGILAGYELRAADLLRSPVAGLVDKMVKDLFITYSKYREKVNDKSMPKFLRLHLAMADTVFHQARQARTLKDLQCVRTPSLWKLLWV